MTLRLEDKITLVTEVTEVANTSVCLVAGEYRGLTVNQMTDLRAKARSAGVYLKVMRNTLAKRALEGTHFDCVKDSLKGPLFLAFSREEPSAAARLLKDFSKENEKLLVKLLSLDGQVLLGDQLKAVASLPTKEEAISQLMSVMQAPIVKLAQTLQETYSKLVRTVAAVRDSKNS